jgi:hypothetical protein
MFEVTPGAVVVHDARVVVIEQREGPGRVRVRDLATGAQTIALIAALRARDSGPVTELFDTHDERRRTVDEKDWIVARERERVIRELLEVSSASRLRDGIDPVVWPGALRTRCSPDPHPPPARRTAGWTDRLGSGTSFGDNTGPDSPGLRDKCNSGGTTTGLRNGPR